MSNLDAEFWNQRYKDGQIGWDVGCPSNPLRNYIDQLENKNLNILIPGGGNAYEAIYLIEKGFNNVTVIDWSIEVIQKLIEEDNGLTEKQLI